MHVHTCMCVHAHLLLSTVAELEAAILDHLRKQSLCQFLLYPLLSKTHGACRHRGVRGELSLTADSTLSDRCGTRGMALPLGDSMVVECTYVTCYHHLSR